jgi:predicted alpha/beta superfamily hydrolase
MKNSKSVWNFKGVIILSFLVAFVNVELLSQHNSKENETKTVIYPEYIVDSLWAKQLQKNINFTVHLPATYKYTTHRRFPLIVMFDRQNKPINVHFIQSIKNLEYHNQVPQAVIIEIETDYPDRWEYSDHPSVRENGKMIFLNEFLNEELIPFINKKYRTNDNKILIGHSAMGHFTNFVLFASPTKWNCIISISSFFNLKKLNLIDSLERNLNYITIPISFYTAQGHPHQDGTQDLLFDSLYQKLPTQNYFRYNRFTYPFANHTTVPGISIGEILTTFWGEYNISKNSLAQRNYDTKGNISVDSFMLLFSNMNNIYKDTIYYELSNIVGTCHTYVSNGKLNEAVRILEFGLRQYPLYYQFYVLLADIHKKNNNHVQSKAMMENAIKVVFQNKQLFDNHSEILKELSIKIKD